MGSAEHPRITQCANPGCPALRAIRHVDNTATGKAHEGQPDSPGPLKLPVPLLAVTVFERRVTSCTIEQVNNQSMALVLRTSGTDPGLVALSLKIQALQSQLQQLKTETETLRQDYRAKCSASLTDATTKLLKLTENVCDADREIIYWYEHGKALRIMLRPLGIKKKTSAIVERRTSRLRNQVASVEREFGSASAACGESLARVQGLNRRINEYNKADIGGALSQANELMSGFDVSRKEVELKIADKELECGRVSGDIAEKEAGIDRLRVSRARTQSARDDAAVVSRCPTPSASVPGR